MFGFPCGIEQKSFDIVVKNLTYLFCRHVHVKWVMRKQSQLVHQLFVDFQKRHFQGHGHYLYWRATSQQNGRIFIGLGKNIRVFSQQNRCLFSFMYNKKIIWLFLCKLECFPCRGMIAHGQHILRWETIKGYVCLKLPQEYLQEWGHSKLHSTICKTSSLKKQYICVFLGFQLGSKIDVVFLMCNACKIKTCNIWGNVIN